MTSLAALTKVSDLTPKYLETILTSAFEFREKKRNGITQEPILSGKVIAMIFEKASLRTKAAFEVAAYSLGGFASFLSSSQILASGGNQQGRESVSDIARNIERFADLIAARVYSHADIEQIRSAVKVPVINLLCDLHHPTQALADIMTLKLCFPNPDRRLTLAFIGDGNNVSTSLMQICAMAGVDFAIAAPKGYWIRPEEVAVAKQLAAVSGSKITEVEDPYAAAHNVDCVYTDTFVSMGQEEQRKEKLAIFSPYQVTTKLMSSASKDAIFLHCLPAYRGEEVSADVMDSQWSKVFDQAESRLHIAKALLALMLRTRPLLRTRPPQLFK